MSARPEVTYEVSDRRFGVRHKIKARTPGAAYKRYLRIVNKALPCNSRRMAQLSDGKIVPTGKPFQRMHGHAPTFEGGWLGVSIAAA